MQEATKIKYRKMAESFYKKHFPDKPPTASTLILKLREVASDYRPDSWRNLRNAIRLDQSEKGYKKAADLITATKNPTTKNLVRKEGQKVEGGENKVKPKQRRCKTVKDETANKLIEHLRTNQNGDFRMWSAATIARITGCRPSEMTTIKQVSDNEFFITGAKKVKRTSKDGEDESRGLDRTVRVLNSNDAKLMATAIKYLAGEQNMKQVQNNIATAARKVFPMHSQRGKRPTLYSFRHQHGSNLKASGMNRVEVAYLMGHQSTRSVEVYGSRRSGSGGLRVEAGVSQSKMSEVVRDNHQEMFEHGQDKGFTMDLGM